ncbi:Serine/threonine-protein kinase KSP1 [Nakaseomyces glabratus]|uniref:non-specific serine/threonine protein kinase n=1 Tax=Candida glabrata TaxID=5478 RepID=A0A0W0DGF7_CANGB|nr:Serine/threonine-protein kinase KSP1 [Nakaseomyces glabratus]KTB02274.1 Serine/threonine-protein kinase KSP1 [Nakaseomyces glabratus]KTB10908.1 Serine/threonine-protein kinase KSP1 [Nakaseomyces glabratus]KTB12412.1 Serine/threonine-protein kinase KSP1 [Nakaseomyces glabratus]
MSLDYEIYKEGGTLNDRYQKIEDLSEGSYGYVSLAKDLKLKRLVAVKYIFKLDEDDDNNDCNDADNSRIEELPDGDINKNNEFENSKEKENSSREKKNMMKYKKSLISSKIRSRLSNNICLEAMYEVDIQTKIGFHENIVQLYDFFDSYIIMEYCSGGDLYEAIKDDLVPKKTKEITHILTQILDAIEFVHNKQIYHRDIKPENILITSLIDWKIKLTDWGLATTDEKSYDRNVGSERYMPPELFESNLDIDERKEPYDCSKVDLWSIGIVFLNVVFYKNPFRIADQSDKSFCYFASNREALFDVFSTMTYDFFQVLRYSLTIDPTNRDIQKIRAELKNLSQYTLDDNYYNEELDREEEEEEVEDIFDKPQAPPSSAPVSLPTPVSSSKPLPKLQDDFTFLQSSPTDVDDGISYDPHEENERDNQFQHDEKPDVIQPKVEDSHGEVKERAKSVPKFRFQKRSKKPIKNNNNNFYSVGGSKAIKIEPRRRSKIIKNSRKPLGIPTPNTHINNYMSEYESKRDEFFHTRQFFTPPSVQNRYMEGIFNKGYNNSRYQNKQGNGKHWNNKYFSHHNGQHQNGKSNSRRRPSSAGINYNGNVKNVFPRFVHNSNLNPNSGRRSSVHTVQHSPGTYIPPNARHDIKNNATGHKYSTSHSAVSNGLPYSSHNNHVPDISTVLDSHHETAKVDLGNLTAQAYRQHIGRETDHFNMRNGFEMDDHEHDSDDILFSLDENEHDSFVDDMQHLSLSSHTDHPEPDSHTSNGFIRNDLPPLTINGIMNSISTRTSTPSSTRSRRSNGGNDLPDLLKSPVLAETPLSSIHNGDPRPAINVNGNPLLENIKHPQHMRTYGVKIPSLETPSKQSQERQFKPGVYVPPHQRRSFNLGAGTGMNNRAHIINGTNEATLSVTPNSVQYGGAYKNRRGSLPASAFGGYNRRYTTGNSAHRPNILQHDIYDRMDNDALEFEDDEPPFQNRNHHRRHNSKRKEVPDMSNTSNTPEEKTMFGPYDIYSKTNGQNYPNARKSSVLQEDMVGSLEQYKNYWLMLQQQQD